MRVDEARAIIEAIVAMRDGATDEQAAAATALYPKWRAGVEYEAGKRVLHNGVLYSVVTAHASQDDWTPAEAPSLFALVLTSDDGTPLPWVQPDSTNPYNEGDKVTHNGATWVSIVNGNVWEPSDAVPTLWERV